jgi:hypothetical protein
LLGHDSNVVDRSFVETIAGTTCEDDREDDTSNLIVDSDD